MSDAPLDVVRLQAGSDDGVNIQAQISSEISDDAKESMIDDDEIEGIEYQQEKHFSQGKIDDINRFYVISSTINSCFLTPSKEQFTGIREDVRKSTIDKRSSVEKLTLVDIAGEVQARQDIKVKM